MKQDNEQVTISLTDEPMVKLPTSKLISYLTILYLLFFFDFVVRVGLSPMLPLIQKDLQLTDPQVGLMGSIFMLAVALFTLPLSFLADKWSKTKLITIMAIIWGACSALVGIAKTFPLVLVGRFGVGLGEAAYGPAAVSLTTTWFPKSKWGKAIAIMNTSMPLGMVVGSIFCGIMAVKIGWRETLIVISIPSVILGFLALLIPEYKAKDKQGKSHQDNINIKSSFARVVKTKSLILSAIASGLSSAALSAVMLWFAIYCVRVLGMTVPQSGLYTGLLALLGAVGFLIVGFFIDKWGKKDIRSRMWIGAICAFIAAAVYALGFYSKSIPIIFLGSVFATMTTSVGHLSTQDLVPHWLKSISYGLMVIGLFAIGLAGPYVTGVLSKSMDIRWALVFTQAFYVLAVLFFIWAGFNYKKDYDRARDEEAASDR